MHNSLAEMYRAEMLADSELFGTRFSIKHLHQPNSDSFPITTRPEMISSFYTTAVSYRLQFWIY